MATKKQTSAERLAAVREKLKRTDMGGGGGGFISLKEGKTVVRILPEVGKMDAFYQTVGVHNLPGNDNKRVYCPAFTSMGELPCPICDLVKRLYQAGDKASKALAQQLRVSKKYWINVINRADETPVPLILTAGTTIFNPIASAVSDEDYGDIWDPENGVDVVIKRTGEGMQTKYEVLLKRNPSPLLEDMDGLDDLLAQAKDLSYVEVSDDPEEDAELSDGHAVYVTPYKRIEEELNLKDVDSMLEAAEDVDEDDDEPRKPAVKASKPAKRAEADDEEPETPRKPARRAVVDEDDDDAPSESRREISQRIARRSGRH